MNNLNGMKKRIISVMAIAAFLLTSVNVGEKEVYADTSAKFSVSLGEKSPSSPSAGDKITFPNAVVNHTDPQSTEKVTCLIINVSAGSITSIPSSVTNGGVVTDDMDAHETATFYWSSGETVENVSTLIKRLEFVYAPGMKITFTVDANTVNLPSTDDKKITTRVLVHSIPSRQGENSVHYYMYVPTTTGSYKWQNAKAWNASYDEAKTWYFMGMRGYLATITVPVEDTVLNDITSEGAWAGGIRLDNTKIANGEIKFDAETADKYTKPSDKTKSSWYWIDGPEAGYYINTLGSMKENGTIAVQSTEAANKGAETHYGGYYGEPISERKYEDWRQYSNWRRQDSKNYEPNNYSDGEFCLQVHYPNCTDAEQGLKLPDTGKYSGWNDLPNEGNSSGEVHGYFVEFSQYTDINGNPNGTYENDKTVIVTLDVDHTHEWTTSADDTTDEITISCPGCGQSYTVKLNADDKTYTASAYDGVTVTYTSGGTTVTSLPEGYTVKKSYTGEDGTTYSDGSAPINAGKYTATVELCDASGNPLSTPIKVNKEFNITKAPLTITASEQNVVIGKDPVSDVSKVTTNPSPLLGTDKLSEITISRGTGEYEGKVVPSDAKITVGDSTTYATDNYVITYVGGTLNPIKKTLTVVTPPFASDITYGQPLKDSQLTGGEVKDEDGNIVPGTWTWKKVEGGQDPDSTYPAVGDSDTTEYVAVFVPDIDPDDYMPTETGDVTLKVTKKEIKIKWNYTEGEYTYDGTVHKPTATVEKPEGFPDGLDLPDTSVTVLPPAGSGLTAGVDATPDGKSYTATASLTGDAANNYVIATAGGNENLDYKVKQAELTVTLKPQTVDKKQEPQGGVDKIAENGVEGLISGDKITDLTVKADRTPTPHIVTGDTITIKNNGNKDVTNNYHVTYVGGLLTENTIQLSKDNVTTPPTVEEITYGDTLDKSVITGGKVEYPDGNEIKGTWKWDEPSTVPDAGDDGKYSIIFTPDDDDYSPIQYDFPVKVKPKEVSLDWGANEFTYNGEEQAPTAKVSAGGILDKDKEDVAVNVTGQKINANVTASGDEKDHYVATAELNGDRAGNYVIKDEDKTHNFKINPLELSNDNTETIIFRGDDEKPTISTVKIKDDSPITALAGKELKKTEGSTPGDYEVKIDEDEKYYTITAEFSGNFKGKATRIITKPAKTEIKTDTGDVVGEMEIFVQVDESIRQKKRNPSIERVIAPGKTEEEATLESFLDTFNEVELPSGDKLSDKLEAKDPAYIAYSDKYIDLYELTEIQKGALAEEEQQTIEEEKEELAGKLKKDIEAPIYLDLTMRQEYEVLRKESDGTLVKISGFDKEGNPIDQVKVSEPIYTNDGEKVKIGFDFPAELIKPGTITRCYVLRMHDVVNPAGERTGVYEPEYVAENQVVTVNNRRIEFVTNKFSTYVVMYTQEPVPVPPSGGGGSTEPSNNSQPVQVVPITPYTTPMVYVAPKTGDTDEVYILIALLASGACWLAYGMIKKRRKEQ